MTVDESPPDVLDRPIEKHCPWERKSTCENFGVKRCSERFYKKLHHSWSMGVDDDIDTTFTACGGYFFHRKD